MSKIIYVQRSEERYLFQANSEKFIHS